MKKEITGTIWGLIMIGALGACASQSHAPSDRVPNAGRNYQRHEINWKKKGTLHGVFTMMCDDSSIDGVEIVVPGSPGKDFSVTTEANITSGRPELGCAVRHRVDGRSTIYTFSEVDGCTITIENRARTTTDVLKAVFDLYDAC